MLSLSFKPCFSSIGHECVAILKLQEETAHKPLLHVLPRQDHSEDWIGHLDTVMTSISATRAMTGNARISLHLKQPQPQVNETVSVSKSDMRVRARDGFLVLVFQVINFVCRLRTHR